MRFGKTLRTAVYPPWKGKYIDYAKLKTLLREHDVTGEDASDSDDGQWTEQDEEAFVQELLNVQLDKVNAFQSETSQQLRERTTACEAKLRPLAPTADQEASELDDQEKRTIASEVLQELDNITKEVSELEKYSRINFTGFLKAAKKHDRKRGARYRVKPLLQVRLSQTPFNSEDYSPLVHRLSVMYSFVREILSQDIVQPKESERGLRDVYSSYKFWVHTDNVLEVKTFILRRLPVLIYNPGSSKNLDGLSDDPAITSLYFDNPQFELYTQKVARASEAGSLRLRWTGQLKDKPPIFLEKKIVAEDDSSREIRVQLKEKHIKEFLDDEYHLDKQVHRMEDLHDGEGSAEAQTLKDNVEELQSFIKEHNLQPMLRANYTRTAFQIPGDNRIRISLDTNLALIREDSLDSERPCREPTEWHRTDLDDACMSYPFDNIRTGEIVRFPHALLEIKLRGKAHDVEWVNELMSSHLVKDAPRFSKFVHGTAQLFEDHVNSFPFWLSELENDIRRDPETAFHEEQERLAKRAEDDMAVGSFIGGAGSPSGPLSASPFSRWGESGSRTALRRASGISEAQNKPNRRISVVAPHPRREPEPVAERVEESPEPQEPPSRVAAVLQSMGLNPKNWTGREVVSLPPGVRHPGIWIKDSGPVRVESKVWLANQRTFIKWLHISILLSSLSLGLYNSAGKHNRIAQALATVYTFFALFSAAWGWYMYEKRSRLIRQRSGKDLDSMFGPIVVCIGLAVALVLNFAFKYKAVLQQGYDNSVPLHSNSSVVSGVHAAPFPDGAAHLLNQQQVL
ncbi:SPX domain protein [Penicillium brasilianum]|uniref:SPX domain protein n=1 Tax=Penicillium brasilianum TaxID=104259 RepID=A0A1S9RFG2_PENBI|nr:SPX domain protein [Penicillium brasilianum]